MLPWGESTLLNRVLSVARTTENVWLATSTDKSDDEIAAQWPNVHRGQLTDVLARFVGCVDQMPNLPSAVLRICADRPFVNPTILKVMLRHWRKHAGAIDYLAPRDLACAGELVSVWALRVAHAEATDAYDREHVTPYVRRHTDKFNVAVPFPLTVDTPNDYQILAPE